MIERMLGAGVVLTYYAQEHVINGEENVTKYIVIQLNEE